MRNIKIGRRSAGRRGGLVNKSVARRGPEVYLHGMGASDPFGRLETAVTSKFEQEKARVENRATDTAVNLITGQKTGPGSAMAPTGEGLSPMMKTAGLAIGAFFLAKFLKII